MQYLGMALMAVGGLGSLVFAIIILVKAFKTSVLWGLVSLFIPFVILIFVFTHWAQTKQAFLYWVVCWVLMIIGSVLGGAAGMATV